MMDKGIFSCDSSKRHAKSYRHKSKPRKELTTTIPIYPEQQSASALQSRRMSESHLAEIPEGEYLTSVSLPPTAHAPLCGSVISSASAFITENECSSPRPITPHLTYLPDIHCTHTMPSSLLPSQWHEGTQPRFVSVNMNRQPQSPSTPTKASALLSPLQKIFSRKRSSTSPRESMLRTRRQNDCEGTRAFPYDQASEGPEPVYVTSLQLRPKPSFDLSNSTPMTVHRSQSSRESSSEGSGGSSHPSSRSSRLGFLHRSSTNPSPSSSRGSRLLDITSWSSKQKPKTNPKDNIRVLLPSSFPQRPSPSTDTLAPFVNMSNSPDISDRYFSSSPPGLMPDRHKLPLPFALDRTPIYSQGNAEHGTTFDLSSDASSVGMRIDSSAEELQERIKKHRRLAYYCINGGIRQSKSDGDHDTPEHIFIDQKGKEKQKEVAESSSRPSNEPPLKLRTQLSRISEHESEYEVESPTIAADKRRRRKDAEIPPPEDEAFPDFARNSAQKIKETREGEIRARARTNSNGKITDRSVFPASLPVKTPCDRLVKAQRWYQNDRPITTTQLHNQSWWERQGIQPPRLEDVDDAQAKPEPWRQRALSSDPEHISPTPISPSLPHFRTIQEAEAYRRSHPSTAFATTPDEPNEEGKELTALPHSDKVEEGESTAASSMCKTTVECATAKGRRREMSRFRQWFKEDASEESATAPSQPKVSAPSQSDSDPGPGLVSTHASSTSLSPTEKVKLRPEPLNLNSIRKPPSPHSQRPKTPFLDQNGRLISRPERQKRFTEIRTAAAEGFDRSFPRANGSLEASPVTSDQTWPSSSPSDRQGETPPSSPPPLTPAQQHEYAMVAASNPYDEDDTSSDGEIVDLYLHPEPTPNPCDGKPHPIIGQHSSIRRAWQEPDCDEKRRGELHDHIQTSRLDPDVEERQQWYESDAKRRIDNIRKALATKSVYGSE